MSRRRERPLGARRSEPVMRAVAERRPGALLAAAEPDGAGSLGRMGDRRERGRLVRSVAEGLVLRLAAGAPIIGLALLQLRFERRFLSDMRRRHVSLCPMVKESARTIGSQSFAAKPALRKVRSAAEQRRDPRR